MKNRKTRADWAMEALHTCTSYGPEGWVPTQDCEEAMSVCKQIQELALVAAKSAKEQAEPWGTRTGTTWTTRNICNESS